MSVAVALGLLIPLLIDARHHILGNEMRLPHRWHLHHFRMGAPLVFALIAVGAVAALRWTQNRYERWMCCSIILWFVYEGIRFAVWAHGHGLLKGPWSWIFWIPATGFAIARAMEMYSSPRRG
jgi:hypothetical protein